MATAATVGMVDVDGLRITYRELGTGPAVLLLHGWPTSSHLWRQVMVPIAQTNRAVAVDLPGFGASDKPLDRRYGFALFERTKVLQAVREPFRTEESRRALAAAGIQLELEGFAETGRRLHELRMPVRIIYGTRDQLLPDVADTMARVERDLPQAVTTTLPNCGHFLQEEDPQQVGELLARFIAEA